MRAKFAFIVLIALSLLLSSVLAYTELSPSRSFKNGKLPVSLELKEQNSINSSSLGVVLSLYITNPLNQKIDVYFVVSEKGGKVQTQHLGEIAPNEEASFDIPLEWSSAILRRSYAVITDEQSSMGYEFNLNEEWQTYQNDIISALAQADAVIVPFIAVFLALLVFILMRSAYSLKDKGELIKGEYTLATLFFPLLKGRPLDEKLADIFTDPFFWIFELVGASMLTALILGQTLSAVGPEFGGKVFLIAGAGALVMPIIYLFCMWFADFYEREPLRFLTAVFIWGIFSAFLAYVLNTINLNLFATVLQLFGRGNEGLLILLGTALLAPVIEEVVKGIGVLIVAGHHEFDDTLDGLIYGFICGVGFSFIEDWFYFASRANPFEWGIRGWLGLILYRSFFNSLAHGCFTAALGAVMGYAKTHAHWKRHVHLAFLPGLFIAILLHILFNLGAVLDSIAIFQFNFPVFIFNPSLVILLTIAFIAVFILASLDTKKRMELLKQEKVKSAKQI
ncbi:MAG: PrsW family intramembrane metalloprotease [Candidatus Micrarchaeota archaeon]